MFREVANTLYRGENENLCVRVCLATVELVAGSAKTGSHRGGGGGDALESPHTHTHILISAAVKGVCDLGARSTVTLKKN